MTFRDGGPMAKHLRAAVLSQLAPATAAILLACGPATAQEANRATTGELPVERIDSAAEATKAIIPDVFYEGWRATHLLDQPVSSFKDEELGQVQDILITRGGQIGALVVTGGGLLGFGEAAFPIPWPLVRLTPGRSGIVVPITKKDAERQGLFGGPEQIVTEPGQYRMSVLLGTVVRVRTDNSAGVLEDVVFGRDGRAIAVVISRPGADGPDRPEPIRRDEGLSFGWAYTDADSGRGFLVLPEDAVEITGSIPRDGSE